jgi:aminoglycoside phosphotransferase (APT) family kinase protein
MNKPDRPPRVSARRAHDLARDVIAHHLRSTPSRVTQIGGGSWAGYLKRELKVEERVKVLEANKMLSKSQSKGLRAVLGEIEDWKKLSPVLNHGDMRLKNTMVDADGKITAIIDWEFCSSNIAPYWDLSLALHDLSVDAKQVFLGGYGLSEAKIQEMAPVLKALNIINYAPFVERAAAGRGNGSAPAALKTSSGGQPCVY